MHGFAVAAIPKGDQVSLVILIEDMALLRQTHTVVLPIPRRNPGELPVFRGRLRERLQALPNPDQLLPLQGAGNPEGDAAVSIHPRKMANAAIRPIQIHVRRVLSHEYGGRFRAFLLRQVHISIGNRQAFGLFVSIGKNAASVQILGGYLKIALRHTARAVDNIPRNSLKALGYLHQLLPAQDAGNRKDRFSGRIHPDQGIGLLRVPVHV